MFGSVPIPLGIVGAGLWMDFKFFGSISILLGLVMYEIVRHQTGLCLPFCFDKEGFYRNTMCLVCTSPDGKPSPNPLV